MSSAILLPGITSKLRATRSTVDASTATLEAACRELAAAIQLLPDFRRRTILSQWQHLVIRSGNQQHAEADGTEDANVASRAVAEPASGPEFVASKCWIGPRQGYVFKTGAQGLGYYRDSRPDELTYGAVRVQ